jgi:lipoprotein-anchoring transpeptidase ErfK/SrfK
MRRHFAAFILVSALLVPTVSEAERVVARISISSQSMKVYHEGRHLFSWTVSTAKPGKITPTGVYIGAEALSKHHRSRLYNNAPMPFAIFYDGHYAIHGTDQITRLGAPASNGCVRLHPDHAAILFQMVKAEGKANLRVEIVN